MAIKLAELARELEVSTESIKNFIQDFDLELSECIYPNFEVKPDFERFARENQRFLKQYEADLQTKKTPQEIADTIQQPVDKVAGAVQDKYPRKWENGNFKTNISSYSVDNQLGGNYRFVYSYFGQKTPLHQKDFIGYKDLFFYISDMLDPFINEDNATNWGIQKAAGIVLYGPPGCGKIFWAKKIAEIISYEFIEVRNSFLGTSFINGKKTNFNDFLISMMKNESVLLFMKDFDEIMADRTPENNLSSQNEQTKEIVLHSVSKFTEEKLVMAGSAVTLQKIDDELLAPGRFDVLIPVFPPNPEERAEMLLFCITKGLEKDATLMKILTFNNADKIPFWTRIAGSMKLYSNTMLEDFVQTLKKKIRSLFLKLHTTEFKLEESLLEAAKKEAGEKLTEEYFKQVQQFIWEVKQNSPEEFEKRLEVLSAELDSYRKKEAPRRKIGFSKEDEFGSAL